MTKQRFYVNQQKRMFTVYVFFSIFSQRKGLNIFFGDDNSVR